MLIACISSDSEVLVKFCHGTFKIIADVRKFRLISRYFLVFQVIFRLWYKLGMSTSSNTSEAEVSVKIRCLELKIPIF